MYIIRILARLISVSAHRVVGCKELFIAQSVIERCSVRSLSHLTCVWGAVVVGVGWGGDWDAKGG